MDFSRFTSTLPLKTDSEGVVRIGETRVTLDSVVGAFNNGSTSEEIVLQFPTLDLADVYAVIGFYLKNQSEIEQYLAHQDAEAANTRQKIETKFPPTGLRQRLLQRRSSQPYHACCLCC